MRNEKFISKHQYTNHTVPDTERFFYVHTSYALNIPSDFFNTVKSCTALSRTEFYSTVVFNHAINDSPVTVQ